MRKLIIALLLVVILLSLFVGVAFATCPEYEDKGNSSHGGTNTSNPHCIGGSVHSDSNGKYQACP